MFKKIRSIVLLLLILISVLPATTSAQSFFKPLPKHPPRTVNPRIAQISVNGDTTFSAFRPIANIAAMSIPAFQAMAGLGAGYQNISYNYITGRYYCNWSISGVMFAGGNIAPSTPTATLTYGVLFGFLNNTVMIGPGINGGKIQAIVSIGINFNN